MDSSAVIGLAAIGGKFTIVVILAGWIMMFFVRCKAGEPKGGEPQAPAGAEAAAAA